MFTCAFESVCDVRVSEEVTSYCNSKIDCIFYTLFILLLEVSA